MQELIRKDYVDEISKGFNRDAECVLKIYYEITQDQQEYKDNEVIGGIFLQYCSLL